MFVNPDHTELIQKEIRKSREAEAAHWRLVREVQAQQPSFFQRLFDKIGIISRKTKKRGQYISLQEEIRESPSFLKDLASSPHS